MIATLNVRADHHNSCEDSVLVVESENFIDGIISDGCSTGIKSHFASQALCYAFKEVGLRDAWVDDVVLKSVKTRLLAVCAALGLEEMNLLATLILFHYNKSDKTLRIRVFGDGYYYINDVEYIIDQNNTPDYFGYHIYKDPISFDNYLKKYPELVYDNVERFMICSDGITRISRSAMQQDATVNPNKLLFHPPTSKNYLERMWNLIKRDKFALTDDLTIVSYGKNS
jgi:hypothetical protein